MEEASSLLLNGTSGEDTDDYLKELKCIWSIGIPIIFQLFCLYGFNTSTQIMVGHIGELQLAAVTIRLSVIGNFALGFQLGMGSAFETLCGRAYGAGQVHMLEVYMQRSWIIMLVCSLIMCLVYVFAGPILKLIGQEEDIAELSGSFSIMIMPQLFAYGVTFPVQKFLQAQSKVLLLEEVGKHWWLI